MILAFNNRWLVREVLWNNILECDFRVAVEASFSRFDDNIEFSDTSLLGKLQ